MAVQITKYRAIAPWRHKATNRPIYCLEVYVKDKGWHGVMDDGAILSFENRAAARNYIAKMKAERTPDGFKKKYRALSEQEKGE